MSKIKCFTSMNKQYYDYIGKLMIESWSKFWPVDCELIVYQEGFKIEDFDRVKGVSWEDDCLESWQIFSKKADTPAAARFAKKGFAMIAGMKKIDCDLLIWVDADLLTLETFSKEKILSILPKDKLIGLFDTYYQINPNYTEKEYIDKNRPIHAAESGFVVINKNHKLFPQYVSEYERLYNQDKNPVGEWFDGNVCTAAAYNFRESIEDLSKLRTTNKTQTPLNRSWLSKFVYHAKAKQKNNLDFDLIRKKLGINT